MGVVNYVFFFFAIDDWGSLIKLSQMDEYLRISICSPEFSVYLINLQIAEKRTALDKVKI